MANYITQVLRSPHPLAVKSLNLSPDVITEIRNVINVWKILTSDLSQIPRLAQQPMRTVPE